MGGWDHHDAMGSPAGGLTAEVQNDFRRPLVEILTKRLGNPVLSTVFPAYTHAATSASAPPDPARVGSAP